MEPFKSNNTSSNISPTSTESTNWNSGKVDLITVYSDDNVGDVVKRAMSQVKAIKDSLNLSDIDISEIWNVCAACPEPEKSIKNITALIINKLKELEDIITAPGTDTDNGEIKIPGALLSNQDTKQYFITSDGDLILSMLPSDFIKTISLIVANNVTKLGEYDIDIQQLESRLQALEIEAAKDNEPLMVNTTCVTPLASSTNPIKREITEAFQDLESAFCSYKSLLGTSTAMSNGVSSENQGDPTSIVDKTSKLWTNAATNVGESLQHMWLAINDVRAAVRVIKDTCCSFSCDDIKVDFDAKLSDDGHFLTLFFITKSSIPQGFTDIGDQGNKLTLADPSGNQTFVYLKIADEISNVEGYTIDLTKTPLEYNTTYYLSMNAGFEDGTYKCVKCINKTIQFKDSTGICVITGVGDTTGNATFTIIYDDGE